MQPNIPIEIPSKSDNRKYLYRKLVAIALCISAFMTILVWFVGFMTNHSYLGFNLNTYSINFGNLVLVAIIGSFLVLLAHKLVFDSWIKALLSCLPVIVLLGLFYLSDAYSDFN